MIGGGVGKGSECYTVLRVSKQDGLGVRCKGEKRVSKHGVTGRTKNGRGRVSKLIPEEIEKRKQGGGEMKKWRESVFGGSADRRARETMIGRHDCYTERQNQGKKQRENTEKPEGNTKGRQEIESVSRGASDASGWQRKKEPRKRGQ